MRGKPVSSSVFWRNLFRSQKAETSMAEAKARVYSSTSWNNWGW